ncbi:33863_t:CDS:2, partial [Gigaspora margarita]
MVGINTRKTDCTDAEWIEYCNMPQICDNKTPKIERYWKFLYTGNKYCGISYNEYLLKVKKKSISEYNYDNETRSTLQIIMSDSRRDAS